MRYTEARSWEVRAGSKPACSQLLALSSQLLVIILFTCGFSFLSEWNNEKGNALYKKGQVGKAKTAYYQALQSDPQSPEAAYNLGNVLYKESDFKGSLGSYEKAARAPKDPDFGSKAFYNLGNSLYRNENLSKSAEFYKQALRLDPEDQDAKYNLELVLKKLPKDEKKDDKKQDPSQGGGQGEQGEQKTEEEKQQGSEGQEQKEGQQGEPKEEKPESGGEGEEEKQGQEPKEQPAGGQSQEEQTQGEQPQEQPKSAEQMRAEQLLGALENQERQVLKSQNDPNKPKFRGRRVAEKDW